MNREIKFRVWRAVEKKMYQPITELSFSSGYYCFHGWDFETDVTETFQFKDTPLMQFTGILDQNGAEVFEGDILRHSNGTNLDGSWEVFWDDGQWKLLKEYDHRPDGRCLRQVHFLSSAQAKTFAVIGNIYENPELLKKKAAPKDDLS